MRDPSGRFTTVEAMITVSVVGVLAIGAYAVISSGPKSMQQGPTAEELLAFPVVQNNLRTAWDASFVQTAAHPSIHEEGGWIYMDPRLRLVTVEIQVDDSKKTFGTIDLDCPPIKEGQYVVADFHTHPHQLPEGREPGPSGYKHEKGGDMLKNNTHGVPGIVVTWGRDWTGPFAVPYGPERRAAFLGTYSYPDYWKTGGPCH